MSGSRATARLTIRKKLLIVLGAVSAIAASAAFAVTARAAPSGLFTLSGTVSYVVDGDTLDVRLARGRQERIRLIGIDTPERGDCHAAAATERARLLALGRRVVLRGDGSQATRDRYGRLLAYVWLGGRTDLGYELIRGGYGKVYVYDNRPFQHVSPYRRAESAARRVPSGLWRACSASRAAPGVPAPPRGDAPSSGACHPSYSPCLPVVGDLDCADVRRLGKAPVRVVGSDPYRLDGDNDGWGCE